MRHNKLLNNLWDSRCNLSNLSNLSNLILLTMALTSTSAFGQAQNVNVIPFKTNHQNTQYYEINLSDAPSTNNVIFFINGSGCQNIKNKLYDYFKPIHNKFDGVLYSLQKIGVNQDDNDNTCSNEFIENDFFAVLCSKRTNRLKSNNYRSIMHLVCKIKKIVDNPVKSPFSLGATFDNHCPNTTAE